MFFNIRYIPVFSDQFKQIIYDLDYLPSGKRDMERLNSGDRSDDDYIEKWLKV